MAATVHQHVSTSATKVNPGDVAALPDKLDLFAVHSHLLRVRLPTGNILLLSALGALSAPSSTPGLLRRLRAALLSNSATAESITNDETQSGRIVP
jgi:hypothetical protein